MRFVTYVEPYYMQERLGIILEDTVVDIQFVYASYLKNCGDSDPDSLSRVNTPLEMVNFLKTGNRGMLAAAETSKYAQEMLDAGSLSGPKGEKAFFKESEVSLKPPVKPSKIIHTAGNFREHAHEGKDSGWDWEMPNWISFLKSPSTLIGHKENIVYPRATKQLDHEIEIGIVIGKHGKYISKDEAYDYIAGYTIFNDITARDVQQWEMKSGLLNFGKNFDTCGLLGPCLATKDEVGDIHRLDIELKVNGDVRQSSNSDHLSVTIPEIVEHYSWVALEPGDIITTGTVSGVAAFRPDPEPFWLKPGDVIESKIEKIGLLRNEVIKEK